MTRPKKPSLPRQEEEIVADLLSTQDLMRGFGRTKLTIETWRKTWGLPYVRIRGNKRGQDAIRFRLEAVKEWALANKKHLDLELLLR